MSDLIARLTDADLVFNVLDILAVAAVFYWLLGVVGGTRAVPVLRGLLVILGASVILGTAFQLAQVDLPALSFIIESAVLPNFILVIAVVFQPELRRALERLGMSTSLQALAGHPEVSGQQSTAAAVARAVFDMAEKRIGALIVIEREIGLRDIADTGTRLDAAASAPVIESIFTPGAPLHDGAALIHRDRIVAAGCVLPLSENLRAVGDKGTRHRAAVGITETSDAVSIVASEETGVVAVAQNGRLLSNFSEERLLRFLATVLSS